MKVAIIGSRGFDDYNLVEATMEEFHSTNFQTTTLVSGGAKGADRLGEKWANNHNIPTKIFLAEWDKYGRAAGFIRNKDIIANADYVIAFWDGESKGTKHSLDLCEKNGILYTIIKYKEL
ncbi:MAG: DUF2493 domain-containing protein [Pelagibacterales bacterium]|nr:DUF2493 domain-containing protein [Pelagibacterales bacterium]